MFFVVRLAWRRERESLRREREFEERVEIQRRGMFLKSSTKKANLFVLPFHRLPRSLDAGGQDLAQ